MRRSLRHALPAGLAVLCLALAVPAAEAATRAQVKRIVVEESLRAGFPPSLAMAVAKAESNFVATAKSSAGARGVMQIMPRTAKDIYGVRAEELWDARLNVQLGIDFLASLIRRYKGRWDIALSHYNGGSAVGHPDNPRVIPATRGYVNKVLRLQRQYRAQAKSWVGELRSRKSAIAMIRAPYSRTAEQRTLNRSRLGASVGDDDFGGSIEVRRRQARRHLDDFAPMLLGPGG